MKLDQPTDKPFRTAVNRFIDRHIAGIMIIVCVSAATLVGLAKDAIQQDSAKTQSAVRSPSAHGQK